MTRFPSVDKRPLDLYKLKKAVDFRGGFDKVCKGKKWAEIGRDLGYSGKIMSSLSTSLKNSYQRWLQPYEDYLRIAKPGVQQLLEMENGGPYTPSPSASPSKVTTQEPFSAHQAPRISAIQSTGANQNQVKADNTVIDLDRDENSYYPTERHTAKLAFSHSVGSGFTPVNAPTSSAFSSINSVKHFSSASKNGEKPLQRPVDNPYHISHTTVPNHSPSYSQKRDDHQLKRKLSDRQEVLQISDVDCSDRKSKRIKKGKFASQNETHSHSITSSVAI